MAGKPQAAEDNQGEVKLRIRLATCMMSACWMILSRDRKATVRHNFFGFRTVPKSIRRYSYGEDMEGLDSSTTFLLETGSHHIR